MTEPMFHVIVTGHEIYETLMMPAVPRKGDILWLQSLTRGHSDVPEVIVSKVEWARQQNTYGGPHDGIHVWLKVRRTKATESDR